MWQLPRPTDAPGDATSPRHRLVRHVPVASATAAEYRQETPVGTSLTGTEHAINGPMLESLRCFVDGVLCRMRRGILKKVRRSSCRRSALDP
jgi:hypothetical protein